MTDYETVIGLEVHVQLGVNSKLFSPAPSAALGRANTRVHHIDIGLPGVLPRPNRAAIELATRAALALGGEIQPYSEFARKHYFYPDQPKGYQISQFDLPLAFGGSLAIGEHRSCRIHRLHVEEDAGKLTHTEMGTLVDLNRAGVALAEIVSEPDIQSPQEAHTFLRHLRETMRFAGVSDCDMELGSMRCDANISLMPAGSDTLGQKVELKNLNSMKMVQRALEYEVRRQTALLASGGKVITETRGWHDDLDESHAMRNKEGAPDYRFLPDPDLPPLIIDHSFIETQRDQIGELPQERRTRYQKTHSLNQQNVAALTQDRQTGDWFEAVVAAGANAKIACNWLIEDLLPALRNRHLELDKSPITPQKLADLLGLLASKQVTQKTARRVFTHLLSNPVTPEQAVRDLGLWRISDPKEIQPLIDEAIDELPQAAQAVADGNDRAIDALKGFVMRKIRGRADPNVLDSLLRKTIAANS